MRYAIMGMLFILSINAFAQSKDRGRGGSPPDREKMIQELVESIDLEENKEKAFLEIFEKYEEKAHELMEGDRKEGFEKMKALEESKNEELQTILSEAEYKKYLSIVEKMRPPKPPNRD